MAQNKRSAVWNFNRSQQMSWYASSVMYNWCTETALVRWIIT